MVANNIYDDYAEFLRKENPNYDYNVLKVYADRLQSHIYELNKEIVRITRSRDVAIKEIKRLREALEKAELRFMAMGNTTAEEGLPSQQELINMCSQSAIFCQEALKELAQEAE